MNKEVVNETQLYLNEPKMALDFLVRNLGFVIQETADSKNTGSVVVCDSYGNAYEVFMHTAKNANNNGVRNLIIQTSDCLQDYHRLESKGICIINKPYYIPEGLAFEISDYWNNRYTLMEKRDYSD